ncbi:NIL domain-containing protein, partial [Peptostreptococcus stomatis]|uniref:NIL domain-containing protein n=1 Tax=Peptostreptococcus stomatis TaxID=341694 RepID=UPI003FA09130
NLKLLFTNDRLNDPVITGMARELSIDVSIIYGKLEKFRENILGSLIINVPRERLGDVEKYLTDHGMRWQEVDNEL